MPSLKTFIYLILSAICGTVLHLTLNHAFKLVDVSMTQPYSFLNLVFASIIGYLVFDEIPDALYLDWCSYNIYWCTNNFL